MFLCAPAKMWFFLINGIGENSVAQRPATRPVWLTHSTQINVSAFPSCIVCAALDTLRFACERDEFSNVVYLREEYSTKDILKILMTEVVCCIVERTGRIRKFCSLWKKHRRLY